MQIKLGNGETAFVEVTDYGAYEEARTQKSPPKVSSDYVVIASDVLRQLKDMEVLPSSIELNFNIKLVAHSGNLLSWVIADASAETSLGIKVKWDKSD